MAPPSGTNPPPPVLQTQVGGGPNPQPRTHAENITSSDLKIAFINCVGQSKFNLAKQLEIQNFIKSHRLDILHLQEVKIENDSLASVLSSVPISPYYPTIPGLIHIMGLPP